MTVSQLLENRRATTIAAGDPRYESLLRGQNHRFVGRPDYICVARTAEQVVQAVNAAVSAGKRLAVRSGGQGFESSTATPDIDVLLELSEMTAVYFDEDKHAFAIEPGATLRQIYGTLFKEWGVTVPAGMCTEVGAGGHFVGGGYGPLSRRHGAVVDYLYGVEVVTVDESGKAKVVVATAEPDDPHRDLWWAHTGGGGGNFGVVTRYWVKAPGTTSTDPAGVLPKAPAMSRTGTLNWSWDSLTEESFSTLMRDFGTWCERNSAADSPFANLFPFLNLTHRNGPPGVVVGGIIDDGVEGAEGLMTEFLATVAARVGVEPLVNFQEVSPWLYSATYPGLGDPGAMERRRLKLKSAYLRKGYTDRQIAAIFRHLCNDDPDSVIQFILIGYGGRVNTVRPEATATAQRDSILKVAFLSAWASPDDDHAHIERLRAFYRDVYADTGGVPAPGTVSDGAYINYPDTDLADPAQNTSGIPWYTLYYKDNYPRLQEIKRRYDPRNEFRHTLAIKPPA